MGRGGESRDSSLPGATLWNADVGKRGTEEHDVNVSS